MSAFKIPFAFVLILEEYLDSIYRAVLATQFLASLYPKFKPKLTLENVLTHLQTSLANITHVCCDW